MSTPRYEERRAFDLSLNHKRTVSLRARRSSRAEPANATSGGRPPGLASRVTDDADALSVGDRRSSGSTASSELQLFCLALRQRHILVGDEPRGTESDVPFHTLSALTCAPP
jgi:hypothetical protein